MGAYRSLVIAFVATTAAAAFAAEPSAGATGPAASAAGTAAADEPGSGANQPVLVETAWDWLPVAGYERESLELALRPGSAAADWSADAEPEVSLAITNGDGVVRITIPATATPQRIQLSGSARDHDPERLGIAFVRPGDGAGLSMDPLGRLHRGRDWAVLVLPRIEAIADRRWAMLLPRPGAHPEPCAIELAPPSGLGDGQPPLAAQIAAAQTVDVQGQAVLIHLAAADRLSGWSQRTWRQSLAWLAADLAARGARRVVLVEPCGPGLIDSQLAPLRRLARDVASAYRVSTVETGSLQDDRYWLVSPGVLGLSLNTDGAAARDRLLAPWRR
ncbi:hypothetical protein LBMAG53_01980 [Planctomycetota bacterium]|nr:hypothetical protein LBMAG53_01980 [Planctomycetota bacterium]